MTDPSSIPDVALVHDYFVQDGGAEEVAVQLSRLFPSAPIHTTFFDAGRFGDRIEASRIRRWPLGQRLPPSPWFRPLLPAYVAHFSRLEVPAKRLVLSNSSTFARGVHARAPAVHVAYIHAPLRFAWDVEGYLGHASFPAVARVGLRVMAPALRRWDRWAGRRADVVVANSRNVQTRIRRMWGIDSRVIHPAADVASIKPADDIGDYYLVATRLIGYKRVDLAVAACARLGRRLIVVGDGPERPSLERMAGPGTTFLGHVDRDHVDALLRRCRALITPGSEDFGLAPIEAMAGGRPVVAYAAGGVLETVVDGVTGVLFDPQTVHALAEAIERLEGLSLDPAKARARALEFDVSAFQARWATLLTELGMADLLGDVARR